MDIIESILSELPDSLLQSSIEDNEELKAGFYEFLLQKARNSMYEQLLVENKLSKVKRKVSNKWKELFKVSDDEYIAFVVNNLFHLYVTLSDFVYINNSNSNIYLSKSNLSKNQLQLINDLAIYYIDDSYELKDKLITISKTPKFKRAELDQLVEKSLEVGIIELFHNLMIELGSDEVFVILNYIVKNNDEIKLIRYFSEMINVSAIYLLSISNNDIFIEQKEDTSTINKLLKTIETKNNSLDELQMLLLNTKNSLDAKIKQNETIQSKINTIVTDYERQLSTKDKKLEDLQEKYEQLKSYTNDLLEDINEPDDKINFNTDKEIDLMGKYIFVLSESINLNQTLINTFPNAILVNNENFDLRNRNIDCVIFLTSCISHKMYFGLKNQCIKNNIPYGHCINSNIDKIKDVIKYTLYKES